MSVSHFLTRLAIQSTIPKGQIDYAALEASDIDLGNLTPVFPRGERGTEQFYLTTPGETKQRGDYRQLQMRGSNRRLPGYLNLDDRLLIVLCRYGERSFVILEYRD